MGTVVHMLISSMANRSSQYVGGGAGKGYCMDDCSVADDALVGPLATASANRNVDRSKDIVQIELSVKPKGTHIDWIPILLNNARISSPRNDAIAAKSDVFVL